LSREQALLSPPAQPPPAPLEHKRRRQHDTANTDDPDVWHKRRGSEGVNEIAMVRAFAGFLAKTPDMTLDDAILLFEHAEAEFPDDLEAFARSKGRSAEGYREGASPLFAWGKRACATDGGKHLERWLQSYAPPSRGPMDPSRSWRDAADALIQSGEGCCCERG